MVEVDDAVALLFARRLDGGSYRGIQIGVGLCGRYHDIGKLFAAEMLYLLAYFVGVCLGWYWVRVGNTGIAVAGEVGACPFGRIGWLK